MRIRRFLGLAAVLVILTSGCGASAVNTPMTLRIWYSTDDPIEHAWALKLPALFERSHHNIRVALTTYQFEDFDRNMQLALSTGHAPDLAYATPRVCGIPVYVQNHKLLNLTPYARRYRWAARLRRGLLQDYNSPFALYDSQKPGIAGRRVPVYAVPTAVAAVGILYNARLLRRLHLRVPQTPGQFVRDLAVAKRAHLTPIAMGNADGWLGDDWYQTLANTRFSYTDLERELRLDHSFTFNRKPFLMMSSRLRAWAAKGYFTPNFGGLDAQDGVTTFFKGRSLFELVSSSQDSQILSLEKASGLNIGVFPFPAGKGRSVMPQSGYEGWIVPSSGHHHSVAITFINWLLKPSTLRFMLHRGMLPAAPEPASSGVSPWQREYLRSLASARPGVYLDAAPIPNLNATMEANVQLLLQGYEQPSVLPRVMQLVYASHGARHGKTEAIDCEF